MAIRYTHKEELWNSWSHAGGIVMGVIFGVIFQLVHRLHRLSCLALTLQMARTLPPLGSCRHLLAHRRQLLATDADSPADPRLLGVVAVLVCVAVCHSGHHRQLRQTAGTLKRRNILFHWYGPQRAGSLQTAYRQCVDGCCHLDYCRGGLLYYWCPLLLPPQEALHAFRLPLLRPCRQHLPHHCRLGRADGIPVRQALILSDAT